MDHDKIIGGGIVVAIVIILLMMIGYNRGAASQAQHAPIPAPDIPPNPFDGYDPQADGTMNYAPVIEFAPSFTQYNLPDLTLGDYAARKVAAPAPAYQYPLTGCASCASIADTFSSIINAMNVLTQNTLQTIRNLADVEIPVPVTVTMATQRPTFTRPYAAPSGGYDTAQKFGSPFG